MNETLAIIFAADGEPAAPRLSMTPESIDRIVDQALTADKGGTSLLLVRAHDEQLLHVSVSLTPDSARAVVDEAYRLRAAAL